MKRKPHKYTKWNYYTKPKIKKAWPYIALFFVAIIFGVYFYFLGNYIAELSRINHLSTLEVID